MCTPLSLIRLQSPVCADQAADNRINSFLQQWQKHCLVALVWLPKKREAGVGGRNQNKQLSPHNNMRYALSQSVYMPVPLSKLLGQHMKAVYGLPCVSVWLLVPPLNYTYRCRCMHNHQLQLCNGSAPGFSEVGAEGVVKFLQTSRHSFKPAHYSTNQCHTA